LILLIREALVLERLSLFALAGGAEVGGSAAEDDALDGGAAGEAGFFRAVVDLVDFLEVAGLAGGVAIVAESAAAMVDGAVEDSFNAAVEAGDL